MIDRKEIQEAAASKFNPTVGGLANILPNELPLKKVLIGSSTPFGTIETKSQQKTV